MPEFPYDTTGPEEVLPLFNLPMLPVMSMVKQLNGIKGEIVYEPSCCTLTPYSGLVVFEPETGKREKVGVGTASNDRSLNNSSADT